MHTFTYIHVYLPFINYSRTPCPQQELSLWCRYLHSSHQIQIPLTVPEPGQHDLESAPRIESKATLAFSDSTTPDTPGMRRAPRMSPATAHAQLHAENPQFRVPTTTASKTPRGPRLTALPVIYAAITTAKMCSKARPRDPDGGANASTSRSRVVDDILQAPEQ